MKLLVTGGREYADEATVERCLSAIHEVRPIRVLIHGGARGADRLCAAWAKEWGMEERRFLPQWGKYKRDAGVMRNKQMLIEGAPDLVMAFPGKTGTKDMVARVLRAGKPILFVDDFNNGYWMNKVPK
jgi:hypothetical protein